MKSIVSFFIKNSIAGNILMVVILLFGFFGLKNMKSTFFPPAPEKYINIQAVLPGASPEEIEQGIVLKIEENLKGLTGIEQVNSVSSENAASVTVEINSSFDIDLVKQDVENAVNQISSFPAGMESLRIYKEENKNFTFSFALSGNVPLKTLKTEARQIEDELRATPIMSKVTLSGFPDEEIEVAFREEDLIRYGISFQQAAAAVQASNLEITGGSIKGQEEELLVRARNKGYYAEELKNIPVRNTADGGIIYLYQLADIEDQWADDPERSFMNGETSVVVTIQNTDEEDLLTIAEYLRNYVDEYNQQAGPIRATTIRDGSVTLQQRIDLLVENGVIGFILVLLALGFFLHWSIAFWVAAAIPISFAGMFIIGSSADLTINVVSLFGMILVIGILVDDGIVIGENIYAKYEQGMDRNQAALEGTMEVLPAVISAILTTIVAFSMFFFIEGRIGDIFGNMAFVVIMTLIFSLVEGMLILPAHLAHSRAMARDAKKTLFEQFFDRLIGGMDALMGWMRDRLFAPVLRLCLTGLQRSLPVAVLLGLMILSVAAVRGGLVKTTFFPFIERDNVDVTLTMPAGTREQSTNELLTYIEKKAWEVNEDYKAQREDGKDIIEKIERSVGPASYNGKLAITLMDGEQRATPVLEIQDAIRKKVGQLMGPESLSYGSSSVFGKPVSVAVLGDDLKDLDLAVEALKKELNAIEGLKDVLDDNQPGLREVNVSLNDKGRQLGLNLQEVLAQVRGGFFGAEAQRLQRGRDEVRVWVRYKTEDRSNIGQLENMRIRFADGREFPLSEIANFKVERGVVSIKHLDGKREVKVEADIANKKVSVSDITTEIKEKIAPRLEAQFPTVEFTFEGQNKEQMKSANSIQQVLPIILILMFIIVALTFNSIGQAVIVFAMIPFGLIGVIWGHWFLDAPISFFSVLGIIALIGIMVNDALVLVSAYNNFIKEGLEPMEAAFEAGRSRFRAIVLTTLTTVLGLGPLMLETSFQAQFLIPMAISVAFGLLVATVVTLLLLPACLLLANRYKWLLAQFWTGEQFSPIQVEAAHKGRRNHFFLWLFGLVVIIAFFLLIMNLF
ncbi:cation/multidrug efflux pump [Saprospira grandis DSM 2844]|uniref:Cation/multidrug efflux pump n=1 Tax=Saprospira grandis DSM 2844 TaxID=694433 RepID=J1HZL0_9BACT|nr:efflux RND transporter permease subunit [Saprospira grandis]EJF51820.1 cation/multidrug efflux pump [Saprospira grandis DSM 2844]